jgi:hypothetical protein
MLTLMVGYLVGSRSRRIRVTANSDGSATVTRESSHFVRRAWRSIVGSWVVFLIGFALLTPFSAGSNADTWWCVLWATAMTIVYAVLRERRAKARS